MTTIIEIIFNYLTNSNYKSTNKINHLSVVLPFSLLLDVSALFVTTYDKFGYRKSINQTIQMQVNTL